MEKNTSEETLALNWKNLSDWLTKNVRLPGKE
jgi:hypothetical protein